jgi:hypothetical protein
MNNWHGKQKREFMFGLTIVLLIMCGLAFNSDINKGLFKNNFIEPKFEFENSQNEYFSKQNVIDPLPNAIGLLIIFLVVLVKERFLTMVFVNTIISKITLFFKFRPLHKVNKISGIELSNIRRRIHKYLEKELKEVKTLFVGKYKHEYGHTFIVLFLMIVVVSMSVLVLTPSFNKGIFVEDKLVYKVLVEEIPKEHFSPEPMLSFYSVIFAMIIIISVSIYEFRLKKK